jgi:hypothetical protein
MAAIVGVRLGTARVGAGDAGGAVGSAGAVVQAAKQARRQSRLNERSGMRGIIAGQKREIKEYLKLENW